jgi:hypothetical protein
MRVQPGYRQHTVESARRRNQPPIAKGSNGDNHPPVNGENGDTRPSANGKFKVGGVTLVVERGTTIRQQTVNLQLGE